MADVHLREGLQEVAAHLTYKVGIDIPAVIMLLIITQGARMAPMQETDFMAPRAVARM